MPLNQLKCISKRQSPPYNLSLCNENWKIKIYSKKNIPQYNLPSPKSNNKWNEQKGKKQKKWKEINTLPIVEFKSSNCYFPLFSRLDL